MAKAIKAALETGDWQRAKQEISRCEKSTLANSELVLACAVNNAPPFILDLLIANGAYCNEKNQFNDTPLTLAIWNKNQREFIAKLIEFGGDVNNRNTNGNCPITLSAETKPPVATVMLLLESGCDVNATNMFGDNCCTLGVWNKSPIELMELYVKSGVDVNHGNVNGNNPLVLAGEINLDPDIVQLLIDAGADVNKPNNFGDTGLTLCAWKSSSLALVKTYLRAGAVVNQRNMNGNSVLSLASEANSSVELITLLLDSGADVNSVNNWGDSALTLACWKNCNLPLICQLLCRGANVFQLNQNQKTALMLAREANAHPKLIEMLELAEAGYLDLVRFSTSLHRVEKFLSKSKLPQQDQAHYRVVLQLANYVDEDGFRKLDKHVLRDKLLVKPQDIPHILKHLPSKPPSLSREEVMARLPILPLDCSYYMYASYHPQSRAKVQKLVELFSSRTGQPVCFSQTNIRGKLGIDASAWFVVFLTSAYMDEVNGEDEEDLAEEFAYAGATKSRRMVVVVCDSEMDSVDSWRGGVRSRLQTRPKVLYDAPDCVEQLMRWMSM
ncbi:hypothetical protein BASA81_000808 [Batrachochytrium salamandrivorans]|nr:hypothetical protein BASA81_000808 [Batrachochytrium salamandrivorans]